MLGSTINANLTPYQGRKRVYGEFECEDCGRFWESGFSWANCGQDCKGCGNHVYPYRQTQLLKKFIGYYICNKCKVEFKKQYDNENYLEDCPKCGNLDIAPYEWERIIDHRDPKKHHETAYCDKCQELGYSCTKAAYSVDDDDDNKVYGDDDDDNGGAEYDDYYEEEAECDDNNNEEAKDDEKDDNEDEEDDNEDEENENEDEDNEDDNEDKVEDNTNSNTNRKNKADDSYCYDDYDNYRYGDDDNGYGYSYVDDMYLDLD